MQRRFGPSNNSRRERYYLIVIGVLSCFILFLVGQLLIPKRSGFEQHHEHDQSRSSPILNRGRRASRAIHEPIGANDEVTPSANAVMENIATQIDKLLPSSVAIVPSVGPADSPLHVVDCPALPRRLTKSSTAGTTPPPSVVCSGHGQCAARGEESIGVKATNITLLSTLRTCHCEEGWESYSCNVPLKRILGDEGYAAYVNAIALDAIVPKEKGPSPPEGNQYVSNRDVGKLLRPIVPLPVFLKEMGWGAEAMRLANTEAFLAARRTMDSLGDTLDGLQTFLRIDLILVLVGLADESKAQPPPSQSCASLRGVIKEGAVPQHVSALLKQYFSDSIIAQSLSVCVTVTSLPVSFAEGFVSAKGVGEKEAERGPPSSQTHWELQHAAVAFGMNLGMEIMPFTPHGGVHDPIPFNLLLNGLSVGAINVDTNLRLAVSQMLTTSVDILGFQSLYPTTPAPADSETNQSQKDVAADLLFVSECWNLLLGRWVLRRKRPSFGYKRHERYTMICEASSAELSAVVVRAREEGSPSTLLFDPRMGSMALMDVYLRIKYVHNAEAHATCERASSAAQHHLQVDGGGKGAAPCSPATDTRRTPLRIPNTIIVGTCAECLLVRPNTQMYRRLGFGRGSRAEAISNPYFLKRYWVEAVQGDDGGLKRYGLGKPFVSPLLESGGGGGGMFVDGHPTEATATRVLSTVRRLFFASSQTAVNEDSDGEGHPPPLSVDGVVSEILRHLGGDGRAGVDFTFRHLKCAKSGGIYGPSRDGRYASYCQRVQRRRDFILLYVLWTTPFLFQPSHYFTKRRDAPPPTKRYAISLHAGNLFGALRINKELLWETDGDFNVVALDDSHEELIQRFERMLAFLGGETNPDGVAQRENGGAGFGNYFTVKSAEDGKRWYASILRDATDFQLNARSAVDPRTRGKPPHAYRVSIMYEGVRVFMNGFNNPWQGVRSAAGHDYRRLYLAQQKWTTSRHHTKSIECASTNGRSAEFESDAPLKALCLPPCNAPQYRMDHNYCDPTHPLLQHAISMGDDGEEVV